DAARLVHWPTSARRGSLVVREHEPPPAVGIALVVDLSGTPEDAEATASRAAGIGRSTLAAGGAVWCCPHAAAGPVRARLVAARAVRPRRVLGALRALGGPAAVRHASVSGPDTSTYLVLGAGATIVALVLAERAGAEELAPLAHGTQLAPRAGETVRVSV